MKLEGEDRERPWDQIEVVALLVALGGCYSAADYFATTGFSQMLGGAVYVYFGWELLPLLWQDSARVQRNITQLREEQRRSEARLIELERQMRDGEDEQ